MAVTVDLGSGFRPDLHSSIKEAVGLDLNYANGRAMVDHPIIADVQNIPIRDGMAGKIRAWAILEHLTDPLACIVEIKRIARDKAPLGIVIPVDSKQIRQNLARFYKEFPFSLFSILKVLKHTITIRKLPGLPHIKQIDPEYLATHFKILNINETRKEHFYFRYGPFRFLKKRMGRTLYIKEFAYYTIESQVLK